MSYAEDRYVITLQRRGLRLPRAARPAHEARAPFRSGSDTEVVLAAYAEWAPSA